MKARLAALSIALTLLFAGLLGTTAQTAQPARGCLGLRPARLIVHERGRIASDDPTPVNLRAEPGTNSEQLSQLDAGTVFYVLEGPSCTVSYTWFRVRARGADGILEGWIAEGDARAYFVERYPPGL